MREGKNRYTDESNRVSYIPGSGGGYNAGQSRGRSSSARPSARDGVSVGRADGVRGISEADARGVRGISEADARGYYDVYAQE